MKTTQHVIAIIYPVPSAIIPFNIQSLSKKRTVMYKNIVKNLASEYSE